MAGDGGQLNKRPLIVSSSTSLGDCTFVVVLRNFPILRLESNPEDDLLLLMGGIEGQKSKIGRSGRVSRNFFVLLKTRLKGIIGRLM